MKKNSFSRNSLISFLTEILVFGFGFLTLIIVTRILGPTGKGIYSLIILIPGLAEPMFILPAAKNTKFRTLPLIL